VTYSPELDLFVAVSSATNYVATSPDGITWTAQTATAGTWNEVVWCDGLSIFVAVGTDISMVSPDGINWTVSSVTLPGTWSGVTFAAEPAEIVAVASAGTNYVMTAP